MHSDRQPRTRAAQRMPAGRVQVKTRFGTRGTGRGAMSKDWTVEDIESLVRDLESLRSGTSAAAALVGCGARAIGPLRQFLLEGAPNSIFQPRQLAVETLAQLGAKDVLIEYLLRATKPNDPVIRFGEDAVLSTAARELSRWRTEDVFEALQKLSQERLLPGVVESLGRFGREGSVPYFLWALGDGVCGQAAEEALCNIGEAARPRLLEAARTPNAAEGNEISSSLQRRRTSLKLLAELPPQPSDWERLRPLLDEKDAEVVVRATRIALTICPPDEREFAIKRLIDVLPTAGSLLRAEAKTCLAENYAVARPLVEMEVNRRQKASPKEQAMDGVLRLLVNLEWQIEGAGRGKTANHEK